MRISRLLLIAALVVALPPTGAGEAEEQDPAGMSPEMLEVWQKMASPNEHHAHLAKMAGTWEVAGTFWMQPDSPPMAAAGISHNEMILGGRFLQTRYKSEFMGEPYTGLGFDGYDSAAGKHVGMWIDSSGTAMYRFEGSCSDSGRVLNVKSEAMDPVSGEMTKTRSVITLDNDGQYTFESWSEKPDGSFYKSMVLVYKRMKP